MSDNGTPAAKRAKTAEKLRLHVYDHCPFCIRVDLALGWRGMAYERVVYGYGDMEGPVKLTGKKILPVLERADGSMMPESLDIIRTVDGIDGPRDAILAPATNREDVAAWYKRFREVSPHLIRPRSAKMPVADWAEARDKEYQRQKYTKMGFDFDKALEQTPELLQKMAGLLKELEGLLHSEQALNSWGLSMDDIALLPDLRNLTCVKGVEWPPRVRAYLDGALKRAGVASYDAAAC